MTFDGEESKSREQNNKNEVNIPKAVDIDDLQGLGDVISHLIMQGKFAFSPRRE